jgi:nitrate/nitrite transport system substrate-binding protein
MRSTDLSVAPVMNQCSRRKFLLAAGAATGGILTHGCNLNSPLQTAPAASTVRRSTNAPETNTARLGFIALTDAAPLIIASEKGYFAQAGMTDVRLVRQPSWRAIQSNLSLNSNQGGLDGAHVLTPIPYHLTAGKTPDGIPVAMYILARLNTNGQGISVANIYHDLNIGIDSSKLKESIDLAKARGPGMRLKVAITHPGGTHDLWMRYWLAAGGIDPDTDVSMFVVPPPQMVANMKAGTMHAFCVGEPWNAQLIQERLGYSALVTGELWQDHPEKSFAMRADWVDRHPKATKALLIAIQSAQIWCDRPENKDEMCRIIAASQYLNVATAAIAPRAKGLIDYGSDRIDRQSPYRMKFWQDNASYPFKNHDLWFLTENMRWGYLPPHTDVRVMVDKVNREDLWRETAATISPSIVMPQTTSRGIETFFDGNQFDGKNPMEYLAVQPIKKFSKIS